MVEIKIDEKSAGGRLDKLLTKYLDKAPSGFIYKMLRKKNIVLNDKKAAGGSLLSPGDIIKIYISDETLAKFKAQRPDSDLGYHKKTEPSSICDIIVFEDDNILAVNKPAGLLSQKDGNGEVSLNDMVIEYLGKSDIFTPGISNRLDRNTSGLVLTGKNPAASRELNLAIKERRVLKHYYALVAGDVPDNFKSDDFLIKDHGTNSVRILKSENMKYPEADPIETSFTKISGNGVYSLIDVDLLTGKSHQIRAHLASYGFPIVGDIKYGDKRINDVFRRKYGLRRHFLHAYNFRFLNMRGILEYMNGTDITANLPGYLLKILTEENIWQHGRAEV